MNIRPLALVGAIAIYGSANAGISVFLDYNGFDTNVATSWAAGGYTGGNSLTGAEILGMRAGIITKLEAMFAGFDTTFTSTNPGGTFELLRMGATTTQSGLFGQAERIDWRNEFKDDIADIYVHNFGSIIMPGSFTRSQNLERLTNAIAGTTAHELGHNLGLQHYDPYGTESIRAPSYGGVTGQQNNYIMATGGTGLSSLQRGQMRFFNTAETVKLEYADGLLANAGLSINESAAPKGTLATAQQVLGEVLPVSGRSAVNVVGSLSANGQNDYYSFTAQMGSLITANAQSQRVYSGGTVVDSVIDLLDSSGNLLVSNNNISYSGNSFMGASGQYGTDSLIQNFEALYSGTYYLRIRASSSTDVGSYQLLLTGLNPVPEPATMAALGAGVLWMARRRRKSQGA